MYVQLAHHQLLKTCPLPAALRFHLCHKSSIYIMDLFLIYIFALVHLSVFASMLVFDSLILDMQSFNPSWPLKNRLWAYPGGKEPSLFVLGLLFCVGISFPVSDSMCTPLICLSMCVIWHLVNPATVSVPCEEGTGTLILQHHEGCV